MSIFKTKKDVYLCNRSVRGIAMINAIEKGIIPQKDGAYDFSQFDKFWNVFIDAIVTSSDSITEPCKFHQEDLK